MIFQMGVCKFVTSYNPIFTTCYQNIRVFLNILLRIVVSLANMPWSTLPKRFDMYKFANFLVEFIIHQMVADLVISF